MGRARSISSGEARRLAIAAQGLGAPRPAGDGDGRSGGAGLRRVMDRVGTIQLDAVNVLARTQYLVPFSRIGAYDPGLLGALSGPGGEWFEYWGHAASLLPIDRYPLFRWRMERGREDLTGGASQERRRAWRAEHATYLAQVLEEVTERGPLTAAQLSEPRRRSGTWWDRRSDGRRALELLFDEGVLLAWRSASFERVYDLTQRAVPSDVFARPRPSEDAAQRELLLIAARSLGVATAADLADYFWLRPAVAKRRIGELVEDGRLLELAVEGWSVPAYSLADAPLRARLRRTQATVLSPFDSLIWNRPRAERLFGLRYRIEIYVPAARRTHGYYVLPVLLGERIVARLDLKADRQARALRVQSAFLEDGEQPVPVAEAVLDELERLRDWLGLEQLAVAGRGDLAPLLAGAASCSR